MTPPLVIAMPQGVKNGERFWNAVSEHCPEFAERCGFAFQGNTFPTYQDIYPNELQSLDTQNIIELQRVTTLRWLDRTFIPDGKRIDLTWPNHEPEHDDGPTWLRKKGREGYDEHDERVYNALIDGIRMALVERFGEDMADVSMSGFQVPALVSDRTPEQARRVIETSGLVIRQMDELRINASKRDYLPLTPESRADMLNWIVDQYKDTIQMRHGRAIRMWFTPAYDVALAPFHPYLDLLLELADRLHVSIGLDCDMRNDKAIGGGRTNTTYGIDQQIAIMTMGEPSAAQKLAGWAGSRA